MIRAVTERDLRMPEFADADLGELEFRGDGKIVRKDRFYTGFRDVAWMLTDGEYEIPDVISAVADLLKSATAMGNKQAADEIWWTLSNGSFIFDQPF